MAKTAHGTIAGNITTHKIDSNLSITQVKKGFILMNRDSFESITLTRSQWDKVCRTFDNKYNIPRDNNPYYEKRKRLKEKSKENK